MMTSTNVPPASSWCSRVVVKYMLPGTKSPGLMQHLREDVLGAAALVGRHDVAVAVVLLDGLFEVIEVAAAGVGLVAQHHAGPLPVAHRAGAAVGQQVDVDVLGAQQEGVVAGLGDALAARCSRVVQRVGSTILIFQGSAHDCLDASRTRMRRSSVIGALPPFKNRVATAQHRSSLRRF